jgi:hypothetical protein
MRSERNPVQQGKFIMTKKLKDLIEEVRVAQAQFDYAPDRESKLFRRNILRMKQRALSNYIVAQSRCYDLALTPKRHTGAIH